MKITISYHTGNRENPLEKIHEADYPDGVQLSSHATAFSSIFVGKETATLYLYDKPARIDYDSVAKLLCIMDKAVAHIHKTPYSLLGNSEKSETVWSDPDSPKEEVMPDSSPHTTSQKPG